MLPHWNVPSLLDSQVDLIGGEDIPSTTSPPLNVQAQSNQDLIMSLFDSAPEIPSNASSPPPQPPRSAHDDIMGLFGPGSNPAPAIPPSNNIMSAFSLPQSYSPAPPPPQLQAAAVPRLTPYTAYDKNELKITLTPQTSAARPGIVNILARFQASGTPVTGLNFQAAVPKVNIFSKHGFDRLIEIVCSHNNCKCYLCQVQMCTLALRKRSRCVLLQL